MTRSSISLFNNIICSQQLRPEFVCIRLKWYSCDSDNNHFMFMIKEDAVKNHNRKTHTFINCSEPSIYIGNKWTEKPSNVLLFKEAKNLTASKILLIFRLWKKTSIGRLIVLFSFYFCGIWVWNIEFANNTKYCSEH